MNTGPYSDDKVQKYLQEEFIPLKSQCFWDKRTDLMKKFNIKWTPTLIILDEDGKEHDRLVGFVPSEDFLAHLALGKGKISFDRDRYAEAIALFRTVEERYPQAGAAPEAIYLLGVAEYWKTHDPLPLRKAYDTLTGRYPQSEWARRARPYSEIGGAARV